MTESFFWNSVGEVTGKTSSAVFSFAFQTWLIFYQNSFSWTFVQGKHCKLAERHTRERVATEPKIARESLRASSDSHVILSCSISMKNKVFCTAYFIVKVRIYCCIFIFKCIFKGCSIFSFHFL